MISAPWLLHSEQILRQSLSKPSLLYYAKCLSFR